MDGLLLALALFATYTFQSMIFNQYFNTVSTIQVQLRGALIGAVFQKSLRLSPESRGLYTTGQIQNLMSTDSRTVSDFVLYVNMLWSATEQIIVAMLLLVNLMGWIPTVAGVLFILASMPLQAALVATIKALREKASASTDDRVKVVSEAIKGIKVVKLYAWELSFVKKILATRARELHFMRKMAITQAWSSTIVSSLPTMLTVTVFVAYVLTGRVLDAAVVFPAIALFNVIRPPLLFLPSIIISAARAGASLSRLTSFLSAEELVPMYEGHHALDQHVLETENVDLAAENASFTWDPSTSLSASTLTSISFRVPQGALVAVLGPTGSGKSTLLAGLLGELPIVSGRAGIRQNRTVSYCDQVPFIQNATLRDNILFGKPYHEEQYRETVRVCCLLSDFGILPAGDMTEIGGRGINLSGGQRARVSLARAVYAQADICLLDDPLSAVDAHVGKTIFNECIVANLHGKTRLLTTNQVHFAASPAVDMIIVVKNGTVAEFGTRTALLADDESEFSQLVQAAGEMGAGDVPEDQVEAVETAQPMNGNDDDGDDEIQRHPSAPVPGGDDDDDVVVGGGGTGTGTGGGASTQAKGKDASSSLLASDDKAENYGAIESGKLIQKETKSKGRVQFRHYLTYFKAMGAIQWVLPIFVFALAAQMTSLAVNVWLSIWSDSSTGVNAEAETNTFLNLIVFCSLGFVSVVVSSGSAFALAFGVIRASVLLHEKLLLSVFGAPSSFFNATPEGRLVNRFNSDMDKVDSTLGSTLQSLLRLLLNLSFTVGLILWATPAFVFVVIPVGAVCLYVQEFYRKSSVDLRRLEALARSPLYSHFGETLDGVVTIRAYRDVPRATFVNDTYTDLLNKTSFASSSANRWIAVRLEALGTILIFGASLLAIFAPPGQLSASMSGLVLSYVMQILGAMNWSVRQFTEAESQLSAIERVAEYSEPPFLQEEAGGLEGFLKERGATEDESSSMLSGSKGLISDEKLKQLGQGVQRRRSRWPKKGCILFDNVTMRYRKDLPPALKSVSFSIFPGEHVGIVGRTGAGKSSAIQCLFRLYELEKGRIVVDDVDISGLKLFDLRSSLGIIPQEPFCFSGTIRSNLDMFGEHDDTSVSNALASCGLQDTMTEKVDLDYVVSEGGSNLSVGQRQLLCLGRALLRDSQVLVLDEATSSVSNATDQRIQKTLRDDMGHCTVLTVAHRLHTVMQSDRIIVMDEGKIGEMGKPSDLLSRPSMLSALVDETGPTTAAHLRHLASLPRDAPNLNGSDCMFFRDRNEHNGGCIGRMANGNRNPAESQESIRSRVRHAFLELRGALQEARLIVTGEVHEPEIDPAEWREQLSLMVSKLGVLSAELNKDGSITGNVDEYFNDRPTDMLESGVQSPAMSTRATRPSHNSDENLPRLD